MPSKPPKQQRLGAHTAQVARQDEARRDKRRGSRHQRGYTNEWARAAKAFLAEPANVLCRHCSAEDRITPATEVDHITPHKGNHALFWNRTNWQPLCHRHHSEKTAREDGGFGRQVGRS